MSKLIDFMRIFKILFHKIIKLKLMLTKMCIKFSIN